MARPDPRLVRKQPVASAPVRAGEIAISPSRALPESRPLRLFAADGRLDLDAVWRLIDHASVIVEGRIYEAAAVAGGHGDHAVFMGSALMSVDLASVGLEAGPGASTIDATFTQRVRDALARDRRTQTILRDRAAREAARLLGPETPGQLEATSTLRARGTTLLIDLDLEGAVESAAH